MSLSRKIAGILVVLALAAVGAVLLIPYGKNFQYQNALDDLAATATNGEVLRAAAVDKAASLGLPLRSSDVKVIPLQSLFTSEERRGSPNDAALSTAAARNTSPFVAVAATGSRAFWY